VREGEWGSKVRRGRKSEHQAHVNAIPLLPSYFPLPLSFFVMASQFVNWHVRSSVLQLPP
jgi:hypothetical protein